jgi:hypothetical protein
MRIWRMAILSGAVLALAAGTCNAGRFEIENALNGFKGLWTRMNYSGGFGTVECEVLLEGGFLRWTNYKLVGLQYGNVLIASVLRCARGGMTISTETLPWPLLYRSYSGILPIPSGIAMTLVGMAFTIREPFGATCSVRPETSSTILTGGITIAGVINSYTISGSMPCRGFVNFEGRLEGTGTANIQRSSSVRTTILLI